MTFSTAQEALVYLVGVLAPLLVALAKQPVFKGTKWNLAISVVACAVIGTVTAWFDGSLVLAPEVTKVIESAVKDIAVVTSLAFVTYTAYWKDTPLEQRLSSLGFPKVYEDEDQVDDVLSEEAGS